MRRVWMMVIGSLACASGAGLAQETEFRSYHVGNSLTWDGRPGQMPLYGTMIGINASSGYHINCNRALTHILADPFQVCVNPTPQTGTFSEALPNQRWDAVVLQPFNSVPVPTLGDDLWAVEQFINLTRTNESNASTRFLIYTSWPNRHNYDEDWTGPGTPDLDTPATRSRAYYDALISQYEQMHGDRLAIVPVGEVLYILKARIEANEIPHVTDFRNQVYRDGLHLTDQYGRHVAAVTLFSVLHRVDPRVLLSQDAQANPANPTPSGLQMETLEATYQVIWEVVSADARTGVVSDCPFDLTGPSLDGVPDGQVNVSDLNYFLALWLDNDPAADLTGPALDGMPDGVVTVSDLNFYIAGWMDEQGACP